MYRLQLILFFIYFTIYFSNAQKQANYWYFGQQSGMEFTTGVPTQVTDGKIDAFEGCSAYSDENGNLLFYTNGGGSPITNGINGYREGIIWNQNHEVVYNMMDIEGGGYSATQSSLFIPKPGEESILYLFTMAHLNSQTPSQPDGRGLSVFEIDLTQNNGLGEVTLADERIYTPTFEALTATQHENGKDFWLVCIDETTLDFVVTLINENGIQSPTLYSSGLEQNGLSSRVLKMSPNGKYLAINTRLYTFDNSTGAVSLLEDLTLMSTYSFSFSPESRYLYTVTGIFGDLIRYDMEAPVISASMETLLPLIESVWVGLFQIGSDGNIYYLNQELSFFDQGLNGIDVIKCPDSDNPVIEKTIFTFPVDPTIEVFVGLPNFADYIFKDYQFETEINFGIDTLFVCPGDSILLDAVYPEGTYEWSTNETTQTILANDFGMYAVTVTNTCGEVSLDSIWVQNIESLEVLEPDSIFMCEGDGMPLDAQTFGNSYLWNNGEEEQSIFVNEAGNYSVTILDGCSTTIETYEILYVPEPEVIIFSNPDNFLCPNDTLNLTVELKNAENFMWSTGEITETIQITESNTYSITVLDENGCFEISKEFEVLDGIDCCMLQYPNTFTPDGDELNDRFIPIMENCAFANYDFKIYNRWGELVFESTDSNVGWDGNLDGKPASSDVFIWVLKYTLEMGLTEEIIETGEIALLR